MLISGIIAETITVDKARLEKVDADFVKKEKNYFIFQELRKVIEQCYNHDSTKRPLMLKGNNYPSVLVHFLNSFHSLKKFSKSI